MGFGPLQLRQARFLCLAALAGGAGGGEAGHGAADAAADGRVGVHVAAAGGDRVVAGADVDRCLDLLGPRAWNHSYPKPGLFLNQFVHC